MIISQAVKLCDCRNTHGSHSAEKNIAFTLDLVAAVALLVIGSLAVAGILPISSPISWALLGGGIVYTAIMTLRTCRRIAIGFR